MEEGNSVVSPAASLRPSAEWNPLIREKPRMNGAPGKTGVAFATALGVIWPSYVTWNTGIFLIAISNDAKSSSAFWIESAVNVFFVI
jgi:hypothetical protein